MLSLQDFFLNYRTIDIEIDIFSLNHRIINRIVKSPLSHSLIVVATAVGAVNAVVTGRTYLVVVSIATVFSQAQG
jgi:hypothetical protein